MAIYAIMSLKGGVGKTMSAMHLAACLNEEKNARVVVVDADEEGSAQRWASFPDIHLGVIPAERNRLAQQVRSLSTEGYEVIIDTPPNNREILSRARMLAEHIVVPVPPTGMDLDRMRPTLELLRDIEATRGTLDVGVLLTQWSPRTTLAREADEALKGFPVFTTRIRCLERYKQSFGTNPSYLGEYRLVLKELRHA
jgi:chromosome partitioning protein